MTQDTGTKTIFSDVIIRNAKKPWLSMTHSDQYKPLGIVKTNLVGKAFILRVNFVFMVSLVRHEWSSKHSV